MLSKLNQIQNTYNPHGGEPTLTALPHPLIPLACVPSLNKCNKINITRKQPNKYYLN